MDRSDPKAEIWPVTGKEPSWNLITAMADDAIDWMFRIHQTDPNQPIFLHYVPGSSHAPHHPTKEWVDKIHAMHLFDDGYEKLRERIFGNQKRLGVIPQDEELTPWPADILTPWDKLSDEAKKLYIRQVEVFAAYVAYNDYEIGRVIQAFDDLGKLDNTLIIYINGDNGTSAEGGPEGTFSEVAFFNGVRPPVKEQMKFYEAWGTEFAYNHMSAGWSWAFNTPFDWFKQNASRLGGVNQNMVISWPARITDKGGLREQFMHVIDVVPTILEVTGISAPEIVDGIQQRPIEGTSFAYTFDAAQAKTPSQHKTQYFEMMGQWALYHDGWLLSTKVNRVPWDAFSPANPDPLNNQVFQLYDLTNNFNQSVDIAAQHPDKVEEMRKMFVEEAKKYQVFPLDASVGARVAAERPSLTAGLNELVYTRPMTGVPQGDAPYLLNTSYSLTADITVPKGGAEGMIATSGGRFAGWGFYLLDGKPVFCWNLLDLERMKWESPDALTSGQHTLEFDFQYDGLGVGTMAFNNFSGIGRSGIGTLKVDGQVVATKKNVMRGLRLLQKHGVEYNILTTVNAANGNQPLEVYRFLRDEVGANWIQFIPIIERVNEDGSTLHQQGTIVSDRSVKPEQFGSFLISIFDEWVRHDVGKVFLQTFEAAVSKWISAPSGMCVFEPTCGHAVALEHNGDLYSCDHFVEPDYKLGNIQDQPMGDLVGSDRQHQFGLDKLETLPKYCLDCDVRFACNGECPKNRFITTPDEEPGLNYLCAGYKAFFHHIDEPLRLLAEIMRRNYPAAQIMPILAAQDAAFAKAHPNDPCPCGSGNKFKKCHGAQKTDKSRKTARQSARI